MAYQERGLREHADALLDLACDLCANAQDLRRHSGRLATTCWLFRVLGDAVEPWGR